MGIIPALAKFLHFAARSTRDVRRFSHYKEIPEAELSTTETHMLQTAWLAYAMLAIERARGGPQLDAMLVLGAAILHDVGEGAIGDARYTLKGDPRVRTALREIEREHAERMFSSQQEDAAAAFRAAFAVEDGTGAESRFFNAVERMGYVYDVFPHVARGRRALRAVLARHHEPLLAYATQFRSVETLYSPIAGYIAEQIAEMQHEAETQTWDEL